MYVMCACIVFVYVFFFASAFVWFLSTTKATPFSWSLFPSISHSALFVGLRPLPLMWVHGTLGPPSPPYSGPCSIGTSISNSPISYICLDGTLFHNGIVCLQKKITVLESLGWVSTPSLFFFYVFLYLSFFIFFYFISKPNIVH